MKYLLLFLFSTIALPPSVNAKNESNHYRNFEICARYRAQQMTHDEAANQLSLTPSTWKKKRIKDNEGLVNNYCSFYQQVK